VARFALAALLGGALAALVACGSSGKGLIPAGSANPLLSDFEAVQHAAETGGGNCTPTNAALHKTEEDFFALPSSVNQGLRANLRVGIENLRARARELCTQPSATNTTTTNTTKTTPSTTTKSTPSTTTNTTTTNTTTTNTGESKETEHGESPGPGGVGAGESPGAAGGESPGAAGGEAAGGAPAGGAQEGAK